MGDRPDEHLHRLASIAVAMVRDESFKDVLRDGQSSSEAHNTYNCLRILADAYVDLLQQMGAKPKFRCRALEEQEQEQ